VGEKMKAVFLDRDGTIARDVHYCSRVEDFEILPGVPQAIRLLNQNGFKVVVITNQSGIARGFFTEETLLQIHEYMIQELAKYSAILDAIFYCPHHPEDGCPCRKPSTGLLSRAAEKLGVNPRNAFVIGDKHTDILTGKAAGCHTVLIGDRNNGVKELPEPPDYIAENLLLATQWILENISFAQKHQTSPDNFQRSH
jgi:D,D-heptose 1,7-bisphosphate phosphatase